MFLCHGPRHQRNTAGNGKTERHDVGLHVFCGQLSGRHARHRRRRLGANDVEKVSGQRKRRGHGRTFG